MIRNLDICYFKDYHLSNNNAAKIQIKKTIVKDYRPKKIKVKDLKPILPHINMVEFLKK